MLRGKLLGSKLLMWYKLLGGKLHTLRATLLSSNELLLLELLDLCWG